jgi:hypothetical protein
MIAGSVALNPGLFAVNPGWGQFIVAVNPGSKFPCLQVWVIIIAGSNRYPLTDSALDSVGIPPTSVALENSVAA